MINLDDIKKFITHTRDDLSTLRGQIEKKKQRKEFLETAPLPRNEFAEKLCGLIDKQASIYPERLSHGLQAIIPHPLKDFDNYQFNPLSVHTGAQQGFIGSVHAFWLFGDMIKQRLRDAVALMPYPSDKEIGPPLSERKIEIENLNKEIALLEAKEDQISQTVNELGNDLSRNGDTRPRKMRG